MFKRPYPFSTDHELQLKKRLTELNENERTNEILFEDAASSVDIPSLDEGCWDMEAEDDNCDMPMGGGTPGTNICELQCPDSSRWSSRKSFPFEGNSSQRKRFPTLEKEESSCGINPSLSRSNSDNDMSQTHKDQAPICPASRRQSRLHMMKSTGKRDPSPIPSAHTHITSFIHSTRRSRGPLNEDEYNMLYEQAKTYKQLSLDTLMRNEEGTGETSHDQPNYDNGSKDINGNDAMEY